MSSVDPTSEEIIDQITDFYIREIIPWVRNADDGELVLETVEKEGIRELITELDDEDIINIYHLISDCSKVEFDITRTEIKYSILNLVLGIQFEELDDNDSFDDEELEFEDHEEDYPNGAS